MKLDLSIDISSRNSRSNENRFGIEDNTVGTRKRDSVISDEEVSLNSQGRQANRKPTITARKASNARAGSLRDPKKQ